MSDSTSPLVVKHLVETDWLEANLGDPDLRILDCTVFLHPIDGGYEIESGREKWAGGHIPGSAFADLSVELSDAESEHRFTCPSPEQFAAAMSRYGVGEGTRVVLYDQTATMWATRLWWMLRAFGFDDAAVLNGGLRKWQAEGRRVSDQESAYPAADFTPRWRAGLFADKAEVLAAIETSGACVLNALPEQTYRARRIPSSSNVSAMGLLDPESNAYLPLDELRARFEQAGAAETGRIINYCGGGIAATSTAFIQTLLGREDVAVYDGSMSEWTSDPSLPTESG